MEILFVHVVNRKIEVITQDETIKGSLTRQLDFILGHYGFAQLNDDAIVNLEKIKSFDPDLNRVYFDEEKLIYCDVSRRNRYKVTKNK